MTNHRIKQIRESLGLKPSTWAGILGVHVVTVYRWEQEQDASPIQGINAHILAVLDTMDDARLPALGKALEIAYLTGGPMLAMHILLREHFRHLKGTEAWPKGEGA